MIPALSQLLTPELFALPAVAAALLLAGCRAALSSGKSSPPRRPAPVKLLMIGNSYPAMTSHAIRTWVAGLAMRFVSGYTCDDPRHKRYMHAWAEVYLPGAGWRGHDPYIGEAGDVELSYKTQVRHTVDPVEAEAWLETTDDADAPSQM